MHQVYSQIAHWRWNQNSCYLKYPLTGRLLQLSPYRGTQFCHPASTHDSFLYHPIITTLHRSCKNCTSFSLQNTSSTNLHACAFCCRSSCMLFLWSFLPLWTATCLHFILYTLLLFWFEDPTIQMKDKWLPLIFLLQTSHLELAPPRSQALLKSLVFQNKVENLTLFAVLYPI